MTPSFVGTPSTIRRAVDRRGLLWLSAALACCLSLGAAALVHIWLRTQVTEAGYRLSKLHAEHERLLREQERLTLQVAALRNPARIEQLARSSLNMAPPSPEQIIVIGTARPQVQLAQSQ